MTAIERIKASGAGFSPSQDAPAAPASSPSAAAMAAAPALAPQKLVTDAGSAAPKLAQALSRPAAARSAAPGGYLERPEVQAFIDKMVTVHGFDRKELETLIGGATRRDDVLAKISRPAESLTWERYRKIFMTDARIQAGRKFAEENRALLDRAEKTYHVPREIIVAILGVETFYGRGTGSTPALDALLTLGFDYPPRAKFFAGELEQYLLMCREEHLDPKTLKGSYAAAFGMSQFISSSYRHYAVDFDGDGVRDLWSTADAIGSVANYFAEHGWKEGEPVVTKAEVTGEGYKALLGRGRKPTIPVADLAKHGVRPAGDLGSADKVALFEQQGDQGKEYWVGLENFYVITRYNTSPLYAMAVHELSQALELRAGAGS